MLDREQLALASEAERTRALRSERQAVLRERARVAREAALKGSASAVREARAAVLPLVPQMPEPDEPVVEGVVIND